MKFWNDLNYWFKSFKKERKGIAMGNMNAKVGDESMDEVVDKW